MKQSRDRQRHLDLPDAHRPAIRRRSGSWCTVSTDGVGARDRTDRRPELEPARLGAAPQMSSTRSTELRQQMIAVIAAETVFLTGELGKAALDSRVLEIMARSAAARIRARRAARLCLRQHAAADRLQEDHLAAVHRRADDRSARAAPRGPRARNRHRPRLPGRDPVAARAHGLQRRDHRGARRAGEEAASPAQGCANVELRLGNGFHGWPEHAPFDKIIVTAGTDLVPPPLLYQLKPGGRMVIPTGLPDAQQLVLVEKDADGRIKATRSPARALLAAGRHRIRVRPATSACAARSSAPCRSCSSAALRRSGTRAAA